MSGTNEPRELFYRRQVSRQHLEVLAQYMERYPPLALASARSREGHLQSKRMWEKIARTLNRIDDSVTKSGKSWARYWIDLKFKIRRKYAIIRKCRLEGAPCVSRLSPYEERIVKILTDERGNLLPSASDYLRFSLTPQCDLDKLTKKEDTIKKQKLEENNTKIDDSGGQYDVQDDPHDDDYLSHTPGTNHCQTEMVNVPENDVKPAITLEDPIQIHEDRKSIEELRRDLVEFELKKQKELFEMEKEQRREKHELEMSILRIKKQMAMKELKNIV